MDFRKQPHSTSQAAAKNSGWRLVYTFPGGLTQGNGEEASHITENPKCQMGMTRSKKALRGVTPLRICMIVRRATLAVPTEQLENINLGLSCQNTTSARAGSHTYCFQHIKDVEIRSTLDPYCLDFMDWESRALQGATNLMGPLPPLKLPY